MRLGNSFLRATSAILAFVTLIFASGVSAQVPKNADVFDRLTPAQLASISADANAGQIDAMYVQMLYLLKTDDSNEQINTLRARAAAAGHPPSMYIMCLIEALPKDHEPSAETCYKAAYAGDANAQSILAIALSEGMFGLKKDTEAALTFYRKAAFQGDRGSLAFIADYYREGLNVGQDDSLAVHYLQRAASLDNVYALRELGRFYALGRGIERDLDKALENLNRAADYGDGLAQYYAAIIYQTMNNHLSAYVLFSLAVKKLEPSEFRDQALKSKRELERILNSKEISRSNSIVKQWKEQTPKPQEFIGGTDFIKRLQAELNKRGFNAGEEDGLAGNITKVAYREFSKTIQLDGLKFDAPDIYYVAYRLGLYGNEVRVSKSPEIAANDPPPIAEKQNSEATPKIKSSGSGFVVSVDGYIVTNAHVVKGCTSVSVLNGLKGRSPARVIEISAYNDLAILKIDGAQMTTVVFRSGNLPKLGESIVVFGFPLNGVLSDQGNLTVGNITALSGLRSDPNVFQISAPVQPGNSGGPVLDSRGRLIGVVVSKLDALVVAGLTDDIPQNVNFAIKSTVLENFLQSRSVQYQVGKQEDPELPITELAESAKRASLFVECNDQ